MMQQAISRSRQTGGSFAASTVIHVLALLLLAFMAGREAVEYLQNDELTEIAYIEARYGEDVAQKVKLKKLDPGPPGRGPSGGVDADGGAERLRTASGVDRLGAPLHGPLGHPWPTCGYRLRGLGGHQFVLSMGRSPRRRSCGPCRA